MDKTPEKLELITQYFNDFTPVQLQQFDALDGLYSDWNSKINVISRKDEAFLYERHVLHSLSLAAAFDFQPGMQVLDLGTGGGFPGIPLAIFFPQTQFVLADSIGKKVKVVQAVVDALQLKNVSAVHTRAEEIKNKKFDVVVSRAVAPLGDLWKWSAPLLKPGGWKGTGRSDGGTGTGRFDVGSGAGRVDGAGGRGQSDGGAVPGSAGGFTGAGSELPIPGGLICLKGGDLRAEIAASGCKTRMMEVHELFPHDFFKEKYILYIRANEKTTS